MQSSTLPLKAPGDLPSQATQRIVLPVTALMFVCVSSVWTCFCLSCLCCKCTQDAGTWCRRFTSQPCGCVFAVVRPHVSFAATCQTRCPRMRTPAAATAVIPVLPCGWYRVCVLCRVWRACPCTAGNWLLGGYFLACLGPDCWVLACSGHGCCGTSWAKLQQARFVGDRLSSYAMQVIWVMRNSGRSGLCVGEGLGEGGWSG